MGHHVKRGWEGSYNDGDGRVHTTTMMFLKPNLFAESDYPLTYKTPIRSVSTMFNFPKSNVAFLSKL
ncbi:hypothetical protein TSUD_194380 [Trifolium subterraneum]|uniref:Uncharacterized protein n=1 Tax=Trifolium subterraneum TaxID=3900 RepID=A0A2Z6NES2_TRISU|nr:hypothetical protein TSUD_194380 [Trifolium subterraneum]